MKLLLMADGYVGQEITRWLIEHYREDIALVVTTSVNDIYIHTQRARVRCIALEDVTLQSCEIPGIVPDLGIMAWWPRIIKDPLLTFPKHGWINTHPSFLPCGRGKHPNFWALVEGAPFGVTLHKVTEEVDAGNIVAQGHLSYDWTDNGQTLYEKAQKKMIELFKRSYPIIRGVISGLSAGISWNGRRQGVSQLHLAKHIEGASLIDLDEEYCARDLLNLLRARTFQGHPACWFEDNGAEYEVRVEIRKRDK